MSGESSFDVVSDFDHQELKNALDQARREITQRYDLKSAYIEIEHGKGELVLTTDDEYHAGVVKGAAFSPDGSRILFSAKTSIQTTLWGIDGVR